MKTEPDWIDIVALIAMHSLMQTAPKNARNEDIAYEAYKQAQAMMAERERVTEEDQNHE
jgi:hypothetical protein